MYQRGRFSSQSWDQLGFVGGRVVEHEVHVEIVWDGRLNLIEEGPKLNRTMPACAAADHRPGLHVEGGEQVGRTLATIIVGSVLRLAGSHRQHRRRARQRLDLRLLIDAQHYGTMRRSQVQADHVPDLVDEGGIGRELEGVGPVRLQPEGAPDPRDHALAHADPPGHGAGRPVGGVLWLALQRECDYLFDGRVLDGTWRTGAGQIDEAIEAMGEEAGAPRRDAHSADAEITSNTTVGRSRLGAGQHDARALSQGLADIAAADEPCQAHALVLGQVEGSRFGTTGHRSPPCGHRPHVGPSLKSATELLTQTTSTTWARC